MYEVGKKIFAKAIALNNFKHCDRESFVTSVINEVKKSGINIITNRKELKNLFTFEAVSEVVDCIYGFLDESSSEECKDVEFRFIRCAEMHTLNVVYLVKTY